MRTYTITEYERTDYDEYENSITIKDVIESLRYIKRGYIGDYNYTGDEDDFERFKMHMAMIKAIEILEGIE